MPNLRDILEPALSTEEFQGRLDELSRRTEPTVFGMRTKLPSRGRADMPVAAGEKLQLVLKTYSAGGENAVHAHTNEEHAFVVLQGRATFYGKDGVIAELRRHQGIMLPRGAFYRFQAAEEENLVMLRIGCPVGEGDLYDRINTSGDYMDGFSEENKEVELVLTDREFS